MAVFLCITVVAELTVAEVATDRVDANCIVSAIAVVSRTFVNVWIAITNEHILNGKVSVRDDGLFTVIVTNNNNNDNKVDLYTAPKSKKSH